MTTTQPIDPTAAFGELGRIKLSETDVEGVLSKISDLARRTIPGTEAVSVTLLLGGGARTAAWTDDLALNLDKCQYERGDGPCLEAAAGGLTLSVRETKAETRWPHWTACCRQAGVNSSLSISLPIHESVAGALNIYARKSDAFDEDAILLAQTFAGYAAVALANAHLYDVTSTLAQHMQAAMESRAVIEQAKGIIMGERRCSADEAFRILSKLSQETNRKVRDVAAVLVAQVAHSSGYRNGDGR